MGSGPHPLISVFKYHNLRITGRSYGACGYFYYRLQAGRAYGAVILMHINYQLSNISYILTLIMIGVAFDDGVGPVELLGKK